MDGLLENIRTNIQECFAEAYDFEDLRDIYSIVRSEADKQFVFIADKIAKERAEDGYYKDNV